MSTVPEIEEAVRQLGPAQLASFRAWFAEFDTASWDRQLEQDVRSGKLDELARRALKDLKEGRCTEL